MRRVLPGLVAFGWAAVLAGSATAKGPAPQIQKGLEMTVVSVERGSSGSLRDCPPGTNTISAVARAGEQIVLVTMRFKVLPAFTPGPLQKPVLQSQDGQRVITPDSFIDVGKVPEFSCTFPFRVKQGTKVKALQIEDASFDLSSFDE